MNTVPSYNYSGMTSKEVDLKHDEQIKDLQDRVATLESQVADLQSRVGALETLTAQHTSQISNLDSRVSALEEQ